MGFIHWLFPPFDPESGERAGRRRFRPVPVRALVPNMITLLALCMGLTAIRMAMEQRFEWAIAAIVIAAVLDMLDGRVARLLKSTSRFGAELDSLADFVNFGVAPAVVLYAWSLSALKSVGWIALLCFTLCCALRLARFNVALESPKPAWQASYFVGMPAPAGAITVLLPVYLQYLELLETRSLAVPILIYTGLVSFVLISRIPTFSGKALGERVPRDMVLPLFILFVLFVACLVAFPWLTLTAGTLLYIAMLPVSMARYQQLEARMGGKAERPAETPAKPFIGDDAADEDRPEKLH